MRIDQRILVVSLITVGLGEVNCAKNKGSYLDLLARHLRWDDDDDVDYFFNENMHEPSNYEEIFRQEQNTAQYFPFLWDDYSELTSFSHHRFPEQEFLTELLERAKKTKIPKLGASNNLHHLLSTRNNVKDSYVNEEGNPDGDYRKEYHISTEDSVSDGGIIQDKIASEDLHSSTNGTSRQEFYTNQTTHDNGGESVSSGSKVEKKLKKINKLDNSVSDTNQEEEQTHSGYKEESDNKNVTKSESSSNKKYSSVVKKSDKNGFYESKSSSTSSTSSFSNNEATAGSFNMNNGFGPMGFAPPMLFPPPMRPIGGPVPFNGFSPGMMTPMGFGNQMLSPMSFGNNMMNPGGMMSPMGAYPSMMNPMGTLVPTHYSPGMMSVAPGGYPGHPIMLSMRPLTGVIGPKSNLKDSKAVMTSALEEPSDQMIDSEYHDSSLSSMELRTLVEKTLDYLDHQERVDYPAI